MGFIADDIRIGQSPQDLEIEVEKDGEVRILRIPMLLTYPEACRLAHKLLYKMWAPQSVDEGLEKLMPIRSEQVCVHAFKEMPSERLICKRINGMHCLCGL